jgi:hypothetical protein
VSAPAPTRAGGELFPPTAGQPAAAPSSSSAAVPPSPRRPLSDDERILHERALRHSLWLAALHARLLGEPDVAETITHLLIAVKQQQGYEGLA